MKTKNKIQILSLGVGLAFSLNSCSDFLDIYPMNEIVLENYWQEEADVENAVVGCYSTMLGADFMR